MIWLLIGVGIAGAIVGIVMLFGWLVFMGALYEDSEEYLDP